LILLDAGGVILDAIRRVPAAVNRVRVLIPRAPYVPPPPQGKADPFLVSRAELEADLARAQGSTLAERLVQAVAGTSPLFARELSYRITGTTASPYHPADVAKLHAELTRVWRVPPEPSIAWQQEQPIAVAAFALTHLLQVERFDSMSAALEKFYGVEESYEAVKAPLREQLEAALDRLARMRANLARELISNAEIESLKVKGEMVLGYQYSLAPGQRQLRAELGDGETIEIALDPNLTPVENANKYFDQYKRARAAQAHVPERLAEVENEFAFATQVAHDLDAAESRVEIEQVVEQARAAALLPASGLRTSGRTPRSEPRSFTSPDDLGVLVGRNAGQNDWLTFERAKADDLWLHARGRAGSHVIILSNGQPIPETTLVFAAGLAAYYSQARGEGAADVIYTLRRNVHRVRGAGAHPGLVTVRDERVIRVPPTRPPDVGE
jgi:predicted ribosome quality control (RQC) complex YloA/Tae2 family protein